MPTLSIKCPNCGGSLQFDPDSGKSKCEYCLSDFTPEDLSAYEQAQAEKKAADETGQSARPDQSDQPLMTYTCNSCGAEVVTEATTSATFCYYCHNPVLLTERLTGAFKPDKIIPFALDKEKAIQTFLKWAKKRRFVPPGFYSASQLEKITGLYIPYWMADYRADVDYAGKGVNLRVWYAGNMEYTEHKEFVIQRRGSIDIDHVHEVAIRKIDKALIDSITPYDETQSVNFSLPYLSGFFAEKYDIQKEEAEPVIEEKTRRYANMLVQESIGSYNKVTMERSDMNLAVKDWHYTLLPTWILTYQYRGKTYVYAVNGQNGKTNGELPVDKRKLGWASGVIAACLFVLALLGGLWIW